MGCPVPAAVSVTWELVRRNGGGSKALHDSVTGVPAVIHVSDPVEGTAARTSRADHTVVPAEASLWVCDL